MMTRQHLSEIDIPIFLLSDDLSCNVTNMDVRCYINSYYESIVHALHYSACLRTVPRKDMAFINTGGMRN